MKLKVTVNPNPFTSELAVFIYGHFTVNTVLRLINSTGAIIRVTGYTVNKGDNEIKIDNLGRYASGNYFLEVKLLNGDLLEMISLVKT
ncbi:MAG: T9SS type A sorting domain-containing protein [Bacteroidota bacterium]